MPYIGRSTDGFGVRNRFLYLASASDTSVSGADANGATLTFTDGAYVDVYLNGVLLKAGTDYNTNTANTIAGLASMAANDEVTVVVYDVFTVGDMVSATSGGTFVGAVTLTGGITGDLDLNTDSAVIKFGADDDVTITHDPDDGLILKSTATGDDNPFLLTLQTGETDLAANDVIGKIAFQAPDEGTGTDAILVSAAIQAVAEGDHSASSNATSLQFMTGASEAAAEKMRIDSSGNVAIGNTSPSSQYMTRLVVGDGSGTEGITVYSGNDSQGRLEFSDATSGDGRYAGGVVYNHSTNKLRFNTNGGNERLSIDSNGYVNMSQQPSISVDGSTSSAVTDSGSSSYLVTQWTTSNDSSFYSQGITYDSSNGRFTVPVAGKYLINVSIYTYQNNVFQRVQLYINGSNNLHYSMDNKTGDGDLGQDNSLGGSTIFNLSANDYIQVYMYKVSSESNKRYYFGAGHSSFSMHLLS